MTADLGYFSSTRPDSLLSAMSTSDTTVVLADGSTFPDPALNGDKHYTVIVGYGTSREEICTVTAKPSATTLTVIRGEDGTPATAKNVGDVVVHGVSAREFVSMQGKLDAAGGTIANDLTVNGNLLTAAGEVAAAPVDDNDLVNKAYADGLLAGVVVDESTGSSTTAAMSQAAAKAYSDAKVVDDSTGSSATAAMSKTAAKAYSDAKVLDSVGSSTTAAMSQNASKTYIDSRIQQVTQAEYDAIPTKDPTVLYVIVG